MEYRPAVDVARLVSAGLIVLFHTADAPYKVIAESGLAFFVLLTFCLQGMGEAGRRRYSPKKRAIRLLGPWVVWSAFYGLIQLVRHQPLMDRLISQPANLLVGSEVHLWFLPFAFLGGLAAHLLLQFVGRLPASWGLFSLCLSSATLAAIGPLLFNLAVNPFGQWHYALPLLPLGLAIGLAQQQPRAKLAVHYVAILAVTVAIAWQFDAPTYLLGVLALAASVLPRTRDFSKLRRLASLSMGIYLIHPFMFLCVYKFVPHATWVDQVSIGLIGATLASALIMLSPRLGSLVFGTPSPPGIATRGSESRRLPIFHHPKSAISQADKLGL